MKPKGDFAVMSEMANTNLEIAAAPDFVSATTAKGGGHITMRVSSEWLQKLALQPKKYRAILYIVNMEQFNAIKNREEEG